MPLVTFSNFLSSKTLARTSQLYPSSNGDSGTQHTGSLSLKTSPRASSSVNDLNMFRTSPKQDKGSSPRGRDRTSKAFMFSLDPLSVVASFRTRQKIREELPTQFHPEKSLSSRPMSHQTQSVYSGYEDEEYGEPEVDAEEIRRPSGLGRRASLTDVCTEVGEDMGKYSVDQGSVKEIQPVQNATEEDTVRISISDASDSESLVEIRYPSGLGNIKLPIHPIESTAPVSTYPHFEPSVVDLSMIIEDDAGHTPVAEMAPSVPSPRSPSVYLSTLLPILDPYLSPQSLVSLTLVDRAVGQEARLLLWRSINMSVTISSSQAKRMSVDGLTSSKILDIINAGQIAHHIKSLELICRLESTPARFSSNFPRSRPPPLILVPKTTTSLMSENTLTVPPTLTLPRSAPLPSIAIPEVQPAHDVVPTTKPDNDGGDDPVALSKMRRASLLLRNPSLTLKNSVPDALRASAAKFRSTNLRLPRSLSRLRSRSSEIIGRTELTTASASPTSSQIPSPVSDVAKTSVIPVSLPSQEVEMFTSEHQSVIVTDAFQDLSPPSTLPSTGWTPPPEWHASPSLVSSPLSFRKPVRSSLQIRPRPPSLTILNHHSDLRLSPSLPSLRAFNSPPPSRSLYTTPAAEEIPPSPMTAVPSPVTPYSAISLSAFPLPPPSVTPTTSIPPFSPESSPMHHPEYDIISVSPAPSTKSATTPTREPRENHVDESESSQGAGLPKALVTALRAMVNLERVTIQYVPSETGGIMSNQVSYTLMRESINLSLVKRANDSLGTILPCLTKLKCLRVVCQKAQDEVCRRQWEEVTQPLKDFDFNVTCAGC